MLTRIRMNRDRVYVAIFIDNYLRPYEYGYCCTNCNLVSLVSEERKCKPSVYPEIRNPVILKSDQK